MIRRRRSFAIGGTVVAIAAISLFVFRRKPASPTVERNLVWIDTVKQGPMVRQVRGLGTLVPEDVRWITIRTPGRLELILLRPGATVEPDTAPIGSKIEQQSLVRARRITVAVQTAPKETEDTIEIVSGHAPATG